MSCYSQLIQTLTSRVMQLNNRSYLSTQLILKRIITDMDIKLTVDLIKPNNRTVRLINVRTNACDFLEKINKNLLFNILKNTLSKHLSGSLKCPFKPFFNYTLNNLFIDEKDFPSYVPECKIRGVGEVYFFQQLSAKFFFNAGVVHKPK
ncbi:uncharacterized protein LOC108607689 [Drosophila busckii]|uniref:uncharacterized protein LOC108607689 n=1 Tax=Drosophila busckii TaxID=30019 RepID=UPI001432F8C7|nr:uncharacterized protein LOC108607689 [Drosophila busckii]